jgi:hypothetical protein
LQRPFTRIHAGFLHSCRLPEGYDDVCELKREGRIGGVSFGIYPLDLWKRILSALDSGLYHAFN